MISIVTPSLDQGEFLEAAVLSVLNQGVEVEYVVVDGGSTDGTVEILRRHEGRLAGWRSEPDGGQYDALDKGFAETSGSIMAWLNADDFYLPGALATVEAIFREHSQIDWITASIAVIANAAGSVVRTIAVPRLSRRAFYRGFNLPARGWHGGHFIPQESTFWRRELWERAGGRLDASLTMAGDLDLWARFYGHAELWGVRALLGAYRSQPAQKTSVALDQYLEEAEAVLRRAGGNPYGRLETSLRGRVGRRVGNNALWRLPNGARLKLEERGLIYRAPELIWSFPEANWVVNSEYFV